VRILFESGLPDFSTSQSHEDVKETMPLSSHSRAAETLTADTLFDIFSAASQRRERKSSENIDLDSNHNHSTMQET